MLFCSRPRWSSQFEKEELRITKTFKNVDPDKQLLVLNAALKEFTEKGFEQASTNQIVKECGYW